jgi:hypothetical protein
VFGLRLVDRGSIRLLSLDDSSENGTVERMVGAYPLFSAQEFELIEQKGRNQKECLRACTDDYSVNTMEGKKWNPLTVIGGKES